MYEGKNDAAIVNSIHAVLGFVIPFELKGPLNPGTTREMAITSTDLLNEAAQAKANSDLKNSDTNEKSSEIKDFSIKKKMNRNL